MGLHKSVKNLVTGEVQYDNLHKRQSKSIKCSRELCVGSSMTMYQMAEAELSEEYVNREAKEFLSHFYKEFGRKDEFEPRWASVSKELEETGTYDLTFDELEYGCRLAWRNAPRCPGRIQWKNLKCMDRRDMTDLQEIFDVLCEHIVVSTNDGDIRPVISVFKKRMYGQPDQFRIWNKQLISYAAYEQDDGTVVGDKAYLSFTKFVQRLGWEGPGGPFDILPIVLSGPDSVPYLFDVPDQIVKKVHVTHPHYPGIDKLNLQWFALPAVSGMLTEVGGLQFPFAPFSGWYSLPEVATRDFLDKQRYDLSLEVAEAMGLKTDTNMNLWRDRVNTELNYSVLHSYMKAKVTIVDHHTQADQFMEHFKAEHVVRGGCPADWVWIIPPEGGSLTTVFHQEMLNYHLTPCYNYQEEPHTLYRFPDDREKLTFRSILKAIMFCGILLVKTMKKRPMALIFYGSETGTSKRYAENLGEFLSYRYYVFLKSMDQCSVEEIQKVITPTTIVLFVVSTFGNGDPPSDARPFALELDQLCEAEKSKPKPEAMAGLRYGVCALGSSNYPNFCAYGVRLDALLTELGGQKLLDVATCDEVSQSEKTFQQWLDNINELDDLDLKINPTKKISLAQEDRTRKKTMYRRISNDSFEYFRELTVQGSKPFPARLVSRSQEGSYAMHIQLDVAYQTKEMQVGDHIAIFPKNRKDYVEKLMGKIQNLNEEDRYLRRRSKENKTSVSSVEEMLTTYYEITEVPTQSTLAKLEHFASNSIERDQLRALSNKKELYDQWKLNASGILETLNEFPSIEMKMDDLVSVLETLKPRWYSLASSPKCAPGTSLIDLVVAIVHYEVPNGSVRKGLTSNFLREMSLGTRMTCIHRPVGMLERPMQEDKPIIMIACGSGIAPFRGVWQELALKKANREENVLFFGCRDEFENLFSAESDPAIRRVTAYSRQHGQPKKYVQDVVLENADLIAKLIFKMGGSILICGSIKMADGAKKTMAKIIQSHFHKSSDESNKYLEDLKNNNRYIEEIFGQED